MKIYQFIIFILFTGFGYSYNNLNQLKNDMENRVLRIAQAAEQIYENKYRR